jgi:hypothetical protein
MRRLGCVLVFLLSACAGADSGDDKSKPQEPNESAGTVEQLQSEYDAAVDSVLSKRLVRFSYAATEGYRGQGTSFDGTAYPQRRAWAVRGIGRQLRPYIRRDAFELTSIGSQRWFGLEDTGCWLRLKSVRLPTLPALDAGIPSMLEALRGLRVSGLDLVNKGFLAGELSIADATDLVALPNNMNETLPSVSAGQGAVVVTASVQASRLNFVSFEGKSLLSAYRAANLTLPKDAARELTRRTFRVEFSDYGPTIKAQRPPQGRIVGVDDMDRCTHAQNSG